MAPSPFVLLLLSALSFQPGSPESSNLAGGERRLGVAATCGHGSEVCAVDGSGWSNNTAADFAGSLPGDLRELRLDLSDSMLDDACLGALAARLPGSLQRLKLDLSFTSVGDRGLGRLAEALPGSLQHLELDLTVTSVGDRGLERLAGALPASLQHLELDLTWMSMGDRGLELLAEALPASLQHLGLLLRATSVGDRGLERLAEALPASLQHLELDLTVTSVGDRGLERLARALPASLQRLRLLLRRTHVGDRGLGRLAALPASLERVELDLRYTRVGDRDLEHLAEALPQQHLKDLAVGMSDSRVSFHSDEALLKKLPVGLQKLSLDGLSCNGWHQAVETMHLSNKSSSDIWPQFRAAMDSHGKRCAVFFVLLAGTPDLKDPTTGRTALMLAAVLGDIDIARYLIRLGADVLARDKLGRSARDFASASKVPGLLQAFPEAPFAMVLEHMTQHMSFWIVTASCLMVAGAACLPLHFWATDARNVEDGPTGDAVRLAAKATHTRTIVMLAATTRLLEVLVNLIGITMLMHRVRHAFALPVCLLLYGLPRLWRPTRGAREAPLGVEMAVTHGSLLDVASSRRHIARGAAFAVARLSLLFILASLSSFSQLPAWMLNGTGGAALHSVTSNERMGVCLDGVAPAMRLMGWRPWNITDIPSGLRCTVMPNDCIHLVPEESFAIVALQSSVLTSRIFVVNSTGTISVNIDGSRIESTNAEGAVPIGKWYVMMGRAQSAMVCPGSSVCLATPRVHQLWSLLTKACQAAVLLWALAALLWALAALGTCALGGRGAHGPGQRRAEVLALARRIAAAGSAEEVAKLRGAAAPVQPARALVLVPPGGIYFTLLLVFADVFLDGYTICTMISNEDVYFAGVLLAASLFSTIREVRSGSLSSLRGWVAETLRTGIIADGLQSLLDNERGSEALISLLVSSYALPFTIKSPMDALLCPLSVLSSAKGLSSFLHEHLDLSLEEPEDEEESEGTKDTESVEQSSDSSCTSSGAE